MIPVNRFIVPSWECVHFIDNAQVCSIQSEISKEKFHVLEIDGLNITGDESLFASLSQAFSFPEYFGFNWDAVNDCLIDVDMSSVQGLVLLVTRSRELWASAPDVAGGFVSIWLNAAEYWSKEDRSFHIVFVL